MSDNESANLISEIKKLADDIMTMSKESTIETNTFNELVKTYYGVLNGVANDLDVAVDINNNQDVASIQTLTNGIVDKLKSDENHKLSKDKLTNLLVFFRAYHQAAIKIGDNIDNVEHKIPKKANENVTPNDNPIKLMVDMNLNNDRIAMGFISEKNQNDTKIFDSPFGYNENYNGYKPHWFLGIPDSKNDVMISYLQEAVTVNKNAKSVTIDGIEYEIVDMEYLKQENEGGMRRRTRKNKRRITKRKVNKNKNKTKGKTRKQ